MKFNILHVQMILYVGNIAYSLSDEDLKKVFEEYGEVNAAKIVRYKSSGRSKGYGFVEMLNEEEAEKAIGELEGKIVQGRNLRVAKAKIQTFTE